MQYGRREIFTDVREVTAENIIQVLQNAFPLHLVNVARCEFLLNYEAGIQPITRQKLIRPEIDAQCVDNLANEIVEFKRGYFWGNPITFVQRGRKDSGNENESEPIALLNENYEAEGIKAKDQRLGRFIEICGVGYNYVGVKNDWQEGDSYFQIETLDPRFAFVIKSSYYIDHREMVGVSYRVDDVGNRFYTAITKDTRYEINEMVVLNKNGAVKVKNGKPVFEWSIQSFSDGTNTIVGEKNPLGFIPIVEYTRSPDRMGCFERQISEMDNLNLLVSDFTNDVEQNTQVIWHTNDVEFPTEEVTDSEGNVTEVTKKPVAGEWMQTFTPQNGKSPVVEPLLMNYDYSGMLSNILSRRGLILQKCHVPQRNDNSGGSTGVAMDAASGWNDAEVDACMEQQTIEPCKMKEVRLVLAAIKASPHVPADSPLLDLKYSDVQVKMKRAKTSELTVKVNALSQLITHGIHGMHAIRTINLFEDDNQVWLDSKELIDKYQASLFDKQKPQDNLSAVDDKMQSNELDQIGNSPLIDGMATEEQDGEQTESGRTE